MKCLLCVQDIVGSTAYYTRECRHVFCETCADEKLKGQLVCPVCDAVMPKDGIQVVNVKPDQDELMTASEPSFGLEPRQLCDILQNGLEFWAQQQQNAISIHVQKLESLRQALEEEKALNRNLSISLEKERRKAATALEEKDHLMKQYESLEQRYNDKSRALRKQKEANNELRTIHKRLEMDIRQAQLPSEYTHRVEVDRNVGGEQVERRRSAAETGATSSHLGRMSHRESNRDSLGGYESQVREAQSELDAAERTNTRHEERVYTRRAKAHGGKRRERSDDRGE